MFYPLKPPTIAIQSLDGDLKAFVNRLVILRGFPIATHSIVPSQSVRVAT